MSNAANDDLLSEANRIYLQGTVRTAEPAVGRSGRPRGVRPRVLPLFLEPTFDTLAGDRRKPLKLGRLMGQVRLLASVRPVLRWRTQARGHCHQLCAEDARAPGRRGRRQGLAVLGAFKVPALLVEAGWYVVFACRPAEGRIDHCHYWREQ